MIANIEEIKNILLSIESKIKNNEQTSIFKKTLSKEGKIIEIDLSNVIKKLSTYHINDIDKNKLEYVYIRSLASNEIDSRITGFNTITSALLDSKSELITYLIAKNKNVSEQTRLKMLTTSNQPTEILIELAHTTTDPRILEYLFNTEDNELKIAVLNNPHTVECPKYEEYYTSSFVSFNNYEFLRLLEDNIPSILKDAYKRQKEIHYLRYDIGTFFEISEEEPIKEETTEEDIFKDTIHVIAEARVKYNILVNSQGPKF